MRKTLHSQVAVVGNATDDESGLVDGRDDQAVRRAGANGDDDVAKIVGLRAERGNFGANFFGELIFVAGNSGRSYKSIQVFFQSGVESCRMRRRGRLRKGWSRSCEGKNEEGKDRRC